MSYQVIFYWDERGRKPVQELIDSLPSKTREKIDAHIKMLGAQGPFLRRPYADKLIRKIHELRVRFSSDNVRILYYFFLGDKAVLLHAFRKKKWQIDRKDIELAERRMCEFTSRYEKGKITL